jgi:hypothetical protein
MKFKEITWQLSSRYGEEHFATVGKIRIGSVFYNSSRPPGSPLRYRATSTIPGIKEILADYESVEEAKARVEKAFRTFQSLITEE